MFNTYEAEQYVTSFLEHVGIASSVATALAREGETLRRLATAAPEGTEYAAALDDGTSAIVGAYVSGVNHEVDLRPIVEVMEESHLYHVVHTHPAGSSFSLADILAFLALPKLLSLSAVGSDGTWYALTRAPNISPLLQDDVRHLYAATVTRLAPSYTAAILRGELTQEDALVELEDRVWRTIAGSLGLRYHRSR